jgi:hypothetical protein
MMFQMNKIEIIQKGEVCSCDIGVSKDEWLALLKDDNMPVQYKEALIKFYYMPEHRGSCTAVCNTMGGNTQSLNSYIARCGEYIQKRLNRFQIIRPNGKPCYWLVPMCEGRDLPTGSEGTFESRLRPELVEAITNYLYWYLVECYKAVRKEIPIDDDKWEELYKWQLITECKDKDLISIVDKVRVTNLVYTALVSPTLDFVIKNRREDFEKALSDLTDKNKPLLERIQTYTAAMKTVAKVPDNDKQNVFGEDERTAAAILTGVDPNIYTIYKYEVYKEMCRYLSIKTKPTGQCYVHFMELIKPLLEIVKNDQELQQLVAPSLKGVMKCDLLLAQDVLWVLFVSFPQKIGFIHSILHPKIQRVWLWGEKFIPEEKSILRCGSSAKTIKDFRTFKSKNALRKAYQKDVGNQDIRIPDAYWSFVKEVKVGDIVVVFETKKEDGKQFHLLHGWGVFTSDCMLDEANDNPMYREVEWHLPFFDEPKKTNVTKHSLFFQGTNEKQAQQIKELLNIDTEKKMEQKYAKYIELLNENHNLVLTGAPGTGKTFMAQEIAKEMGAITKFVQFHPSYDYTDFVEGLRPVEKEDGQMGFERKDGVFKEFCREAIKNLIDSEKSIESLTKEMSWQEKLERFVEYAIEEGTTFKTVNGSEFVITDMKNHTIVVHNEQNEKTTQVAVNADEILDLLANEVTLNIVRDIRNYFHRKFGTQPDSYAYVITKAVRAMKQKVPVVEANKVERKPYVFIIDEINRGEASKIFGELFFAIDPGYRGKTDNMVQTQYQNLIPETDVFAKGFYVPENVYILATMNDIDRSVESMDFAMRRRFTWKEVTPADTEAMLDTLPCSSEAKATMARLNKAISETDGLGTAYQIGPSYFLKLGKNGGDFNKLWEMSLEPLLKEYLRGFRKTSEILDKFSKAYFGTKEEQTTDSTELIDED